MHPKLLEKISSALNHDMFQHLHAEGNSPSEINLKQKIAGFETENEELKNEIIFLKEIIHSLRKK